MDMCMQLPKLLELVGLGYTSWFVYRYLLFKVSAIANLACTSVPGSCLVCTLLILS